MGANCDWPFSSSFGYSYGSTFGLVKVLVIDIETAPKLAYVWRFFKENVSPKQVLENGHIMSFSSKWLGSNEITYEENRKADDGTIVARMVTLLDEADIAVAHNGERFDFPQIAGRALVHGISPPSPFKMVDTLKVAKKEFGFPSNSLAYIAQVLGVEEKQEHKDFPGFELWLECLRGNDAAWEEMKVYNIQDVLTLEQVYLRMLPYIRNHPNVAVYGENTEPQCPKCGSAHLHWRGYSYTNVGQYHRFQCQSCGGWGRTRHTIKPKEQGANLVVNAVS